MMMLHAMPKWLSLAGAIHYYTRTDSRAQAPHLDEMWFRPTYV